jgi:uncharacterized membrane protein YgcG
MQTFATATLNAQTPQTSGTLQVQLTSNFHFVLAVAPNDGTDVAMTILDSNGNVVGLLDVTDGNTDSLTLTLNPGTYTVELTAYRTDGKPLTPVQFVLQGDSQSGEIGPQATNTSSASSQSSGGSSSSSGSTSSSSSGSSSSSSSSYQWTYGSTSFGGPSSQDPYSTGYSA